MLKFFIFSLFIPFILYAGEDNNRFIRIGTGSVYSAVFLAAQKLAVDSSFTPQYDKKGQVLKAGVIVAAQSFNDTKDALNALVNNDVETAIIPSEYLFDRERGISRFTNNDDSIKDIVVIGAIKPMVGYFITRNYIKKLERKYLISVNLGTNISGTMANAVFADMMEQINLLEGDYNLINRRYEDLFVAFNQHKIDGFFIFDAEPIAGLQEFLEKNNAHILNIPLKIGVELRKKYISMEINQNILTPHSFVTFTMPLVWVSKRNYNFQIISDLVPHLKKTAHQYMQQETIDGDLSLNNGKRIIKLETHPALEIIDEKANNVWLKGIKRP